MYTSQLATQNQIVTPLKTHIAFSLEFKLLKKKLK